MAHIELIRRIVEEVTGMDAECLTAQSAAEIPVLDALDLCLVILNVEEALDILIENEEGIKTLADLVHHVQNAVA